MINSATYENSEIKIFKTKSKRSFVKIKNWLAFKVIQKSTAVERNSWGLLIYVLSLEFNTDPKDLTPKSLSEKTGQSKRTIFSCFKFLSKVGHIRTIKIRDHKNKIIGAEYEFYAEKFAWEKNINLHNCEIIEENGKCEDAGSNENKQLDNAEKNINLHNCEIIKENVQKEGCSYNARASSLKTRKDSSSRGALDLASIQSDAAAPLSAIENELKGQCFIGRDLVERCLDNFGPEYTLEAIRLSKEKNPTNPGAFFNGASITRYSTVDIRLTPPKQSPAKTTDSNHLPGFRNAFLESIIQDMNFEYYLELTDEALVKEDRFKSFLDSKGYEL